MKKILAKVLYVIFAFEVLAGVIAGVMVYFIRSFDKVNAVHLDGLGRVLVPTPFIMRFFLGVDSMWPGWTWFFIDLMIFWGAVAIGYFLLQLAAKLEKRA